MSMTSAETGHGRVVYFRYGNMAVGGPVGLEIDASLSPQDYPGGVMGALLRQLDAIQGEGPEHTFVKDTIIVPPVGGTAIHGVLAEPGYAA